MMEKSSLIIAVVVLLISICDAYKIGLGRADVTGPSVEIAFVSRFTGRQFLFISSYSFHNF